MYNRCTNDTILNCSASEQYVGYFILHNVACSYPKNIPHHILRYLEHGFLYVYETYLLLTHEIFLIGKHIFNTYRVTKY